jgi:hypothetical protein
MLKVKDFENIKGCQQAEAFVTHYVFYSTLEIKIRIAVAKQHSLRRRCFSPADWAYI